MINGFKLLKDPKPVKEEIPVPLITWDEVLKTSNIIDSEKEKSKKFFIQNSSEREKTLHNLLNKNSKNTNNLNESDSIKSNFLKPTEKM